LISGEGETSNRLPAFSLFLPGTCPNTRDRRTRLGRGAAIIINRCEDDDPKIALFELHTGFSASSAGETAGWMKEAPMVDRLSRKATGRHRAAGMTQRYNHSKNLAANSLQIQPAEVICSIYDCGRGGFGLPSAKSRTTSGATRPL
jgi:hypothetical protein